MRDKKGQLVWDRLIPWIIVLLVIGLMIILYVILTGKGQGAIEYLKSLFRFGR